MIKRILIRFALWRIRMKMKRLDYPNVPCQGAVKECCGHCYRFVGLPLVSKSLLPLSQTQSSRYKKDCVNFIPILTDEPLKRETNRCDSCGIEDFATVRYNPFGKKYVCRYCLEKELKKL